LQVPDEMPLNILGELQQEEDLFSQPSDLNYEAPPAKCTRFGCVALIESRMS
jgi:hypothetical protein